MRISMFVAVTAATSLAIAVPALAIDVDQSLTVKTTGVHGTKTSPRPIAMTVTTRTSAKDPAQNGTFGTKRAVIRFDRHLKFNNRSFPTCSVDNVIRAESKCPRYSRVGSGDAAAQGGTQPGAIMATPSIRAYNGVNGTLILKLISPPGQFDATGVIVAKLQADTGVTYGSKLVVPIPAKYYNQLGINITLTKFLTSVKGTYRGKPYIASTGCSTGRVYKFGGEFLFTDNTLVKVKTTSNCS